MLNRILTAALDAGDSMNCFLENVTITYNRHLLYLKVAFRDDEYDFNSERPACEVRVKYKSVIDGELMIQWRVMLI